MVYSKGISWLDDTRIPFVDDYGDKKGNKEQKQSGDVYGFSMYKERYVRTEPNQQGRFTPNLLCCDDVLNDGIITGGKDFKIQNKKEQTIYGGGKGFISKEKRVIKQDKGSNSRYYNLDLWFNQLLNKLS